MKMEMFVSSFSLKITYQSLRKIGCSPIAMTSMITLKTGARNKKNSGKKIVLRLDFLSLTMTL